MTSSLVKLEPLAALISRLGRELAREGLPVNRTRLALLVTLRDRGPTRITDLATGEHVAQPTMTTLVAKLAEQGWVERQPDPADRRVVNVAITPAGLSVLERAVELRDEAFRRRLERLTPEQRAALAGALDALQALSDQ
jgi:DNA-binding MarR family transcriptional regulator